VDPDALLQSWRVDKVDGPSCLSLKTVRFLGYHLRLPQQKMHVDHDNHLREVCFRRLSSTTDPCRTQKDIGVSSCSAPFLHPRPTSLMHTIHEYTSVSRTLICFRDRRLSCTTPTTTTHGTPLGRFSFPTPSPHLYVWRGGFSRHYLS